jgi:phosphatidylserine/phosphatidylglycerophosphate/cardiolipin synthase-like enzyme
MRFKSKVVEGFQAFAVSGVNTVSFAIDKEKTKAADRKDLLGFAVERIDPVAGERYFVYGFKVFRSVIPKPEADATISTRDHPVQSLVWDDFTCKPGQAYTYLFYPVRGKPKKQVLGKPIEINVETEPLFSGGAHDIFFNRGVASSQAYTRKFGNVRPDAMQAEEKAKALKWLGRELDEAILKFIAGAKKGDTLLGCFYEFRFLKAAQALREAITRGVKVQLILDGKKNTEEFPSRDNRAMVKKVKIPASAVTWREAKPNDIQHNKFMVLLKGKTQKPAQVWTGSTNLSDGGVYGQTNVGHWVRDAETAASFQAYWDVLAQDPGGTSKDSASAKLAKNKAFKEAVEAVIDVPLVKSAIPAGITPVFSPRQGLGVLELYAALVDEAEDLACITLAFGINKVFKERAQDNTANNALAFYLLEKQDKPNPQSKQPFIRLSAKNNLYMAWGSYLKQPLHQWAKETTTKNMKLNSHVMFIHSKFLLADPLGADPIVVTGSANFSEPSQGSNDENMLVIRGDTRVADIYFTEFNRLFHHYYFRSVTEATLAQGQTVTDAQNSLFLQEDDGWLEKYRSGTLRDKRVRMLAKMAV